MSDKTALVKSLEYMLGGAGAVLIGISSFVLYDISGRVGAAEEELDRRAWLLQETGSLAKSNEGRLIRIENKLDVLLDKTRQGGKDAR